MPYQSLYSSSDLRYLAKDARELDSLDVLEVDAEIVRVDSLIALVVRLIRELTARLDLTKGVHRSYSDLLLQHRASLKTKNARKTLALSEKVRQNAQEVSAHISSALGVLHMRGDLDTYLDYRKRLIYARSGVKMSA